MVKLLTAAALALVMSSTAQADALRDLCPSRPGLNTPACTVDPGHLLVEAGIVDWTRDTAGDQRTDEIDTGQFLLHLGIDKRTEVQLAWTAYGEVRTRSSGGVMRDRGVGDVTIAVRRALAGPNGPVAIQSYVTLPVGGSALGLGDYSAGVLLPIAVPLGGTLTVEATPEIDWLPDSNGDAHHVAYGSAFGLAANLTKQVSLTVEGEVTRDDDPVNPITSEVASASLAWQPGGNTQFDVGVVKGLRHAPDIELYVGYSRRF